MDLLEVSAVVLAQNHNPSILHPAFLVAQGIVPAEWELAAPSISMPPLATAIYNNGISFAVDESRLIIRDTRPLGDNTRFRVYELANSFVQRLPHVPYTAVGVNFQAFLSVENALDKSLRYFFRPDVFANGLLDPASYNFSIQHDVEDATRTITVSPAGRDFGRTGLIVHGNYHVAVGAENRLAETRAALDRAPQYWQNFTRVLQVEHEIARTS